MCVCVCVSSACPPGWCWWQWNRCVRLAELFVWNRWLRKDLAMCRNAGNDTDNTRNAHTHRQTYAVRLYKPYKSTKDSLSLSSEFACFEQRISPTVAVVHDFCFETGVHSSLNVRWLAYVWPWSTKAVLSRWGIFIAIVKYTLYVSNW